MMIGYYYYYYILLLLLLLLLLDVHPFFDSKKMDGDVMVQAPLDLYSFWMGSDGLKPPITSASLAVLGPNGTLVISTFFSAPILLIRRSHFKGIFTYIDYVILSTSYIRIYIYYMYMNILIHK